ncbi:hypothetical protein [Actinacidiphila glaucinigra]|uniref:Uncharacterized protein n=1 Tax=Actinacidiphila glaucinigra TaxID=235986 RepID=A0A239F368_9ACTN|nr:hypothetical protein [Actinacidiphila glaucinigra]SNS50968.1 hypothetical protein SAMN05216252_106274 [Actinacidiphila glaucinigra]
MTEATAKKTAAKRPARVADPLASVVAEVHGAAKGIGDLPSTLIGGHLPERGADNYRKRGDDWDRINQDREAVGRLGIDGLAVQVAFAAFGGRTLDEIRGGLVRLASLAVAAIGQIDREGK